MMNDSDIKIAVVLSMFNQDISNNLLNGAKQKFIELNGNIDNLILFEVSGAFEIPSTVKQLLKNNHDLDAIVTLGCVIKGETAHFEYISSSVTDSISKISIEANIPIIYGILTTYDEQQALERSDPSRKDKGGEVMQAAIDTVKTWSNFVLLHYGVRLTLVGHK